MNVQDKYAFDLSGQTDNAPKLAQMASDIAALFAAKKPLPRLTFPEGILSFSAWPDLAYDNLQIVADGECRLMYSGTGNGVVFDASLRDPASGQPNNNLQPQIENLLFEGFDVYASQVGTPLVFRGIHRSNLSARVIFNPSSRSYTPRTAIEMTFCIVTTLHPVVSGNGSNPIGLLMDAWPGKPALQSTAATIANPCLEGCSTGILMASAGSCMAYGGTIESNNVGIELGAASGNNMFYSVEMEGNGQDVNADSGAHNNGFLYCGNSGKVKTNFPFFSTNWVTH